MSVSRLGVCAFAAIAIVCYSQSNRASFPGEVSNITSPDGRYIIRSVDNTESPYHSLFLTDQKTSASRKILDYGRTVTVVWSPRSKFFFCVEQSTPKIDVQEELTRGISGFRQHKWDHDYFGVSRWIDNRRVSILFWGHGGVPSREFCQCYIYTLDGSVQKCANQPKGNNLEQQCGRRTP